MFIKICTVPEDTREDPDKEAMKMATKMAVKINHCPHALDGGPRRSRTNL